MTGIGCTVWRPAERKGACRSFFRYAGVLLLSLAAFRMPLAAKDGPLPEGASEFGFEHREKRIKVLTYKPEGCENGSLLVLFHGATRDAAAYLESGKALADRFGMLLAVPEFDRERFDPEAYQEGGVFRGKKPVAPEDRTFAFVGPLVGEIARREGRPGLPHYLVGHSAGAQFVGRLAGFPMQEPGPERIVVVNAGSLLFPTRELPYPYGFGGLPGKEGDDDAIRRYLAMPQTFYIGTADTGSERLPVNETAMKQGEDRVERARRCFEKGRRLSEARGWPFAWTLVEAEGLDHRSTPMWKHPSAPTAVLGPKGSGD